MSNPTGAHVRLQMSYSDNSDYERTAHLDIEDVLSGLTILSVKLDGSDIIKLISGREVRTSDSSILSTEGYSNLGKIRETKRNKLGFGATESAIEDAKKSLLAEGFTKVYASNHSYGKAVTGIRFVEPTADQIADRIDY